MIDQGLELGVITPLLGDMDTSNEIGGHGDIHHDGIGRARCACRLGFEG